MARNLLQVGNSWRTTADIGANWEWMLRCLDNTIGLSRFAGPGHWNDPDMLEVALFRSACTWTGLCTGTGQTLPSSADGPADHL